MRHAATQALLERNDVVIVASVSCIYGIGSVETYARMVVKLETGGRIDRDKLAKALVELQYRRNDAAFQRGTFRLRGEIVDIFPSHYEDRAWRVSLFGDEIESIHEFDPLTGEKTAALPAITVYANSHYVTPRPTLAQAVVDIKRELKQRLDELAAQGKLLEVERLQQRCTFDIEMMETTGSCKGIENYSRYLTGRNPGEPPPTLFEYLPENALLIVDESHVTVPQIGGMYRGDFNRKSVLADFGFRLPSCIDNRPLKFEEWDTYRPPTLFVSATPGPWELERTGGTFAEQVIRPTGLIDPVTEIRPVEHQVDDLLAECRTVAARGGRVLVTTLTKRMAEDLTDYLTEHGLKVRYLHSDIDTLERIDIIRDLRLGVIRCSGGHQPAARGARYPRMHAGGDPGRRQGRLPAFGHQPDPDHRAGGAQCRGAGDPVRRHNDPQPAPRDRGDRPAAEQADRMERGARHHAAVDQEADRQRAGLGVRAGLRDGGTGCRGGAGGVCRQGSEILDRRAGEADARRRGGSGIRAGGAAARRDPPAGGAGARDRAAAGRFGHATAGRGTGGPGAGTAATRAGWRRV